MNDSPFSIVSVLGSGLIGGSFALAVRQAFPHTTVIGWDRPEVLQAAATRRAITQSASTLAAAVAAADLVYLALPIGVTLDLLPEIARHAQDGALVTDAAGAKSAICRSAAHHFSSSAEFLGGHPLAGREHSGIDYADANLFRGAKYVLVSPPGAPAPSAAAARFEALLRDIGAEPVWMDADTHDWAVGIVSHLPQLASIALANVVNDETDETGLPLSLSATGLRDALRLAGSPYSVWRDVCLTNRDNLARSLDRLIQALEHLRGSLSSRDLEPQFDAANQVYKSLRQLD
ncbi:MAG TPA: prephenate dehydrogenase/arogenate dehydrogenase family protein [Candidatus Acidoferrales bacterium]|nr:prephenate dehydrogenase/arogenate dehydrogenase family protein [Candidatus Acidoferrales bacterium]